MKPATLALLTGIATHASAGVTLDDLSIATFTGFDHYEGNTANSSDDMNGIEGIFSGGNWSGGDDVFTLDWRGGNIDIELLFDHANGDLDLFLWADNGATIPIEYSLTIDDNESIFISSAPAGIYYISVDGWFGAENSYDLFIGIPTPASTTALVLGALVASGRRRTEVDALLIGFRADAEV